MSWGPPSSASTPARFGLLGPFWGVFIVQELIQEGDAQTAVNSISNETIFAHTGEGAIRIAYAVSLTVAIVSPTFTLIDTCESNDFTSSSWLENAGTLTVVVPNHILG